MSDVVSSRKGDHLRIALEDDVEPAARRGPFECVSLVHQALPEIDRDDVETSTTFLGRSLRLPLIIGSMTGGTADAGRINRRLAEAAQRCGVGMGLGSQRVMLEDPASAETFDVRAHAPDIPIVANIGAVQLRLGVGADEVRGLAQGVGADGVVFHLNAAQEAIQPEGDTCFGGLTDRLGEVMDALELPCGLKEVGAGFSIDAARRAASLPLAFLESAGRGGTSWTLIEGLRSPTARGRGLGDLFADWGIPSVTSLLACVRYGGGAPVIASGGLRTGLDAAKALSLGARCTAMALPLLRAAHVSADRVVEELERFSAELRTAMFLVGARTVDELRSRPARVEKEAWPETWELTPPPPLEEPRW